MSSQPLQPAKPAEMRTAERRLGDLRRRRDAQIVAADARTSAGSLTAVQSHWRHHPIDQQIAAAEAVLSPLRTAHQARVTASLREPARAEAARALAALGDLEAAVASLNACARRFAKPVVRARRSRLRCSPR